MATVDHSEFRLNNFDLIRLFAAAQVMVVHVIHRMQIDMPLVFDVLSLFHGVPIFFVTSGFLVSASLERSGSLQRYFANRARRIFPGLWACILATAIVVAVLGFPIVSTAGVVWFVAQLVGLIYTPNFLDGFGMGAYNGSLWTIPVELQFYVVLPFIYLAARQAGWNTTRTIAVLFVLFLLFAIISRLIFPSLIDDETAGGQKLLRYSFLPHVYLFLLGVLLQRINAFLSPLIRGKALYWLAAYVLYRLFIPANMVTDIISLVFLGIVTMSFAYTLPGVGDALLRGHDISYGVYIYHGLIINILIVAGMTGNPLAVPVTGLLTVLVGLVSWLLVERRFLKRTRRKLPLPIADAV